MPEEENEQLVLPGLGESLAGQAVGEAQGELLDLDTARFVSDVDVATVHLVNDLGQRGDYAVLHLEHSALSEIQDEDAGETCVFIFGSSASLELTINLLKSVQGYVTDPEAQENQDV